MRNIIINGATEGNLQNLSVEIPRNKLVVLTGLSGSGKSTLAIDVLYQECQRQFLEAIGYQGIRKPKVESIRNVSPAIRITQTEANRNPRSTVGTVTNLYTELRMVYEKLAVRHCPECGELIAADECKEELVKANGEFTVFMHCSKCGHRMLKLSRTQFSYNTREGACPTCKGLGKTLTLNEKAVIRDDASPENGAVAYWDKGFAEYLSGSFYNALKAYGVPAEKGTPVAEYSPAQKTLLLYGAESDEAKSVFPGIMPPKTVSGGRFEGVFTALWRKLSDKGGEAKQYEAFFDEEPCPDCEGERLCALSRSATVNAMRLPELCVLSLEELNQWLKGLDSELSPARHALVDMYLMDMQTKINRLCNVGLSYLSLDRQTITLSGGELQRLKLAATLDSDMTGVIYILDEPTIGLHPRDTAGMLAILKRLRDLDNTVIVIEHDIDVMREADHIIDIGPGAGRHGGFVTGEGSLAALQGKPDSATGRYLAKEQEIKTTHRSPRGWLGVHNASLYNLKHLDVRFPVGCLTAVTGVSGSGKSTLVFEVLATAKKEGDANTVTGMETFDRVVTIEQAAITKMKRSNVATYSEMYTEIRAIFGDLPDAKAKGLTAKHFSFNTRGGRCENCEGLGYVTSNLLFFDDIEVTCPVCGGNQFNDDVLSVRFGGRNIKDILKLSVEEAREAFSGYPKIAKSLSLLQDVGLGYLDLGQSVTTLSGGECQRLKLARELLGNAGTRSLYLMDEPTTGLHPLDVENFLLLLNRMVDAGNTVIVVEHNQQIALSADWLVDLGPDGGAKGGQLVFSGMPHELAASKESFTRQYMFSAEPLG